MTLKTVLRMVLGSSTKPASENGTGASLQVAFGSGVRAILDNMASGPSRHGVGLHMYASGSQFDRKVAICHLSRWLMRLRRVGRTYTVPLLNNIDAKTRIFSGLV